MNSLVFFLTVEPHLANVYNPGLQFHSADNNDGRSLSSLLFKAVNESADSVNKISLWIKRPELKGGKNF